MSKKNKILHLIYIAVILALMTSVVILSVKLNKLTEKDGSNGFQKYYQDKCQSYGVQNANLSKGQIVFIGDSITDLFPLDDYFADLNLATYNRGIGGDSTKGVLDRLQVSLFDIQPSKVVLLIGINDINGGVASSKIIKNYRKILSEIKEKLPTAKVYCVSILPMNSDVETYSTTKVEKSTEKILEINPQIKAMTDAEPNMTYIDLYSSVQDGNDRLITAYSDDGIHLNNAGFAVWASVIKPYLQ